ncbi:MAG TPA: peptidylprolyl isomerase, partial [Ignavibacteriaceae bacterium]|nr:peptidylprolyl isomerase [Ignavibacteriaceae bacterium]
TLLISALPEPAVTEFLKSSPGTIVGPVSSPQGYVLYNYLASVPSNETYARASHILINQFGNDTANYQEAMKVYNDLVNGASFEKFAMEKSKDPGSGAKGGDLGWFSKGAMVPEFEKAVFEGKEGVVQKPVKTNYGYHIIKVTGKSNNKFVVEKIVNPITTSATTRENTYGKANDFSYIAEKNGFEKEAELVKYNVLETAAFVEKAYSIPGLGTSKRIIDFAFNNDVGTVSEVFKVQTGYAVVMVSEITEAGVKPFDEVKDLVKSQVIREKKYEKAKSIAENVKKKIGNDINKASQVDGTVKVDTTGRFTGTNGSVPKIGREFSIVEKAQSLELNKISDPVKGNRGYFLMKVLERTQFDSSAYSVQRTMLRDQIMNEKKGAYFSLWLSKAKEEAEIEDNRHLYFEQ